MPVKCWQNLDAAILAFVT